MGPLHRIFLVFCHILPLVSITHRPRNHDSEMKKMADEWKLTKTIDRCEGIQTGADQCLWSFHCTVLTDYSLADELKLTNTFSKDGRRMKYSTADQHYLTRLIILSVPPLKPKDKASIGRQNGAFFHSSAALCCQPMHLHQWPISTYFVASWKRPFTLLAFGLSDSRKRKGVDFSTSGNIARPKAWVYSEPDVSQKY